MKQHPTSYTHSGDYPSPVPPPICGKENHCMDYNHAVVPYGSYHVGSLNATLPRSQCIGPFRETIHQTSNLEGSSSIGSFDGQKNVCQQYWRAPTMAHIPSAAAQKHQLPHMVAPLCTQTDTTQPYMDDAHSASGQRHAHYLPTSCSGSSHTFNTESTFGGCGGPVYGVNGVASGPVNTFTGFDTPRETVASEHDSSVCREGSISFIDVPPTQVDPSDWLHHQSYTSRAYPGVCSWWP